MERDLTGAQIKVWKLIRNENTEINGRRPVNTIKEKQWIRYFKDMYDRKDSAGNTTTSEDENSSKKVAIEDIQTTISKLKNNKTPGMDGIANEILKYGEE
ncbi:hypothetical protein ILUMI_16818, partial [Ignelater luminosus]